MSAELTPRFFRRLRLAELITSVCILAVLALVLVDQASDESASPPSVTISSNGTVGYFAAYAEVVTTLESVRTALES